MTKLCLLSLTADQHDVLRAYLYPGDGKEAAAIALCGTMLKTVEIGC